MSRRRNLSVYHLKNEIDGEPADQFVDLLREPNTLKSADPMPGLELDFTARLFWSVTRLQTPAWLDLFTESFDDLSVPTVRRVDGVLIVEVEESGQMHRFAFTFGHGRHLLQPGAMDRGYGLKAALNVIYLREGAALEPSRIRSVDSKIVAEDTINTRRQADRRTDFEAFELDTDCDFLKAITGLPKQSDYWGTRVSGGDSLSTNPVVDFANLGAFCRSIIQAHGADSYKREFSWVDKLQTVSDPALLELLRELSVETLNQQGDISIAVPELVEWGDIEHFRYSFDVSETFSDPEDSSPTTILNETQSTQEITVENLRRWKLEAVSPGGEVINSWSLIRCVSGQLELNGDTYVASEGNFYAIDTDYLSALDSFIETIPESQHELPPSEGDPPEGEYNEFAALSSDTFLLLDKRTVRITNKTSPIEICDILTSGGAFIHVKRKLGSSSLSHLFAQGSVSADLFLMSPEYRTKTLDMVQKAENERSEATGDDAFIGRFSTFDLDAAQPRNHEIVYAVVAKWRGRTPRQALPFFSKVNLRRHISDLKRMGFPVSFARIEVSEPE